MQLTPCWMQAKAHFGFGDRQVEFHSLSRIAELGEWIDKTVYEQNLRDRCCDKSLLTCASQSIVLTSFSMAMATQIETDVRSVA